MVYLFGGSEAISSGDGEEARANESCFSFFYPPENSRTPQMLSSPNIGGVFEDVGPLI